MGSTTIVSPSSSVQSGVGSCPAAAQPRIDEATILAVQQQVAQQAALAQIPDAVKRVRLPQVLLQRQLLKLYYSTA